MTTIEGCADIDAFEAMAKELGYRTLEILVPEQCGLFEKGDEIYHVEVYDNAAHIDKLRWDY